MKTLGKKGVTLIELLISIMILGVIALVTATIFEVAIDNYRSNIQKSSSQKNLNFTLDSLANNIKSAKLVPAEKEEFSASANTLILAIPTKDSQNNFVYNGEVLESDYFIYYISEGKLHKKLYTNPAGKLSTQNQSDTVIMNDVSDFKAEYSPGITDVSSVKITITLNKTIDGRNISITQSRTANLRNKE